MHGIRILNLYYMAGKIHFYSKSIKVDSYTTDSAQAAVYFGRHTDLGIKVVLKQYNSNLSGLFREIKIFTELERL